MMRRLNMTFILTYDDAVIQWWEQASPCQPCISVEQLLTLNLMNSHLNGHVINRNLQS